MLAPIKRGISALQHHSTKWWYPPVIGLLALADLFLLVIPTDAILVSAVVLNPRRWLYLGLVVAFGSAVGCAALAGFLRVHGLPFLLHLSPNLEHTHAWAWTAKTMSDWGAWGIFLVALSPMMQHPAIALAAISGMAIPTILAMVFAGRALKYLFLAWLASHSPRILRKLWVIRGEMKDAGLCQDDDDPRPECVEKRKNEAG